MRTNLEYYIGDEEVMDDLKIHLVHVQILHQISTTHLNSNSTLNADGNFR